MLAELSELLMAVGAAGTVSTGPIVGTETTLRKVFRDDASFGPGRELAMTVAGNERDVAQVLVRPVKADIPSLSVDCTDLTGPGGCPAGCVRPGTGGRVCGDAARRLCCANVPAGGPTR